MLFLKNNDLKIAYTKIELVNEILIIDLIENKKLSYKQASSFLKERFDSMRGLSSWSVMVTVTIKPMFEETVIEPVDELSIIYNFLTLFVNKM